MLNIARNTAIDHLRSKSGKADKLTSSNEDLQIADNREEAAYPAHENIGLKEIVNVLKQEQKLIITLAFFEGYTQNEIAQRLNIPLGTVKTRYRNALHLLKNSLKEKITSL
jgi:RNA polymerase sigma-70 factor (ECF subfamily)